MPEQHLAQGNASALVINEVAVFSAKLGNGIAIVAARTGTGAHDGNHAGLMAGRGARRCQQVVLHVDCGIRKNL